MQEETLDELLEELALANRVVAMSQALLESPDWGQLVDIIVEQINARKEESYTPLRNQDDVLARQMIYGEISGMFSVATLPATLKESAEFTITELKSKISAIQESEDGSSE